MTRRFFNLVAIVALSTFASCNNNVDDVVAPAPPTESENFDEIYAQGWEQRDDQSARLTLSFDVTEAEITRSSGTAMERNINDVNLYFFNELMGLDQRIYIGSSSTITLPITPGEWEIYAIANIGYDMGDKSLLEVTGYEYQIVSESDLTYGSALVMSYNGSEEINDMKSLNIRFSRAVSRVDLRLSLTGNALSNVKLDRLRLVNVPKKCTLFESSCAPSSSELISYAYNSCGNGTSISFYMLENLSGSNTSITDQSSKIEANAPSTAAYIEIEAETSDSWVTYRVYLGANNTNDFNIERNTIYDVAIVIHDADPSDLRTTIEPFPRDISISVSASAVDAVFWKPSNSFTSTHQTSTCSITIKLSEPSNYNITVRFTMMADFGDLFGGIGAVVGDFSNEQTIYFAAGATSGSLSFTGYHEGLFAKSPTHAQVSEVIRSDPNDKNNYILSPDTFTCTYTSRWQNY